MHFGLGLLRLAPETFWALTLCELLALGGTMRPAAVMDRSELAAMMRRWPDRPPG